MNIAGDGSAVTFWSRLLLDTSDPTLKRAHQVQVHDPLWFLARQWQVGELTAFDGGSPVNAMYQLQQAALTAYQPAPAGPTSPPVEAISATDPPLEVRVEREAVQVGLRGSVQLGFRFEAILRSVFTAAGAATGIDGAIAAYRSACAISAAASAGEIPDPKALAFRQAMAGRVTDGWLLFQAAIGSAQSIVLPTSAADAVTPFVAYCQSVYTLPSGAAAWNNQELAFEFRAGVETTSAPSNTGLNAPNFSGGRLDWYSFDYSTPAVAANNAQPLVTSNNSIIPTRLAVPGMPGTRFWEFEDGQTNLGDLETQTVDLTKMLLADFAAIANNNWFQFSIVTPVGTLNRLAVLRVTDSFGAQTLIPATGELDPPSGTGKAWQMFTLDGDSSRRDTLLLPPVLGRVMDGPFLEDVLFFRDDMAAMTWAIEQSLDGPLDTPISGFESLLTAPPPALPLPAGADLHYLAGTTVPKNWIPMLPYEAADSSPMLRRGAMYDPTSTPPVVKPRGVILTPGSMLVVRDQAVPRAGVRVQRYVRRARWIDGSTYCWMARCTRPGKGEGSSGLAFDVLR